VFVLIAAVAAVAVFKEYWPYIVGAVALILIIILVNAAKKSAARKAAENASAEKQRQQQEETKRRIEEDKQRVRDMAAQAQAAYEAREKAIEEVLAEYPEARKYRLADRQDEAASHLLTITEFTPISKKRYVAFDLETTGLSSGNDNIIEIGAVRVVNGQIEEEFQQLVDPVGPIPADASAVNHITDDMVRGQPKIYEVLPAFLAFVGDDVLAAHNVRFDAGFLNQACLRNRFSVPAGYFDTMALARYWPQAENKKLGTLAATAGIESEEAHRALGDARTVAALISATNKLRSDKAHKKAGEA